MAEWHGRIGDRRIKLQFDEVHTPEESIAMARAIGSCIARFPPSMVVEVRPWQLGDQIHQELWESITSEYHEKQQQDRISPSGFPRCGSFNGTKE